MKLEPFSSWPASWDPEIQKIFRLAQQLGVKRLRVKTKLGTLRIQEGGAKLMAAIEAADRATQIVCPACGGARPRQTGHDLELCPACSEEPGATIEWVDRVTPYTPADPVPRRTRSTSKVAVQPLKIDQLEQIPYPGLFTVASHYSATGEGVVIDILMGYARDAAELRSLTLEHIPEYFARYADYYPQLFVPAELSSLMPAHIQKFVDKPDSIQGAFFYLSRYRLNRS